MIDFIDLKSQQARLKEKIDAGIQRVLAHGQYILGPEVQELEEKLADFSGAKYCITCANGTDALQIAQMALGIGPGDEVISLMLKLVRTLLGIEGTRPLLMEIQALVSPSSLGTPRRAVVGFDARRNSRIFAEETAAIFTAAGLETFLMPSELPTPVLAYAIRPQETDCS